MPEAEAAGRNHQAGGSSKVSPRRFSGGEHTRNLLRRHLREMIDLSLIRRTTAVPEESPLQGLVALQLVLEPERVVLVVELEQVENLRGRLDDGERRGLTVVHERGDAAVGVETQKPFFLLLVGRDVDQRRGPLGAVLVGQFFEDDLRGLAVGRVLRDQVQTFGVFHLCRCLGDVQVVCGHGVQGAAGGGVSGVSGEEGVFSTIHADSDADLNWRSKYQR